MEGIPDTPYALCANVIKISLRVEANDSLIIGFLTIESFFMHYFDKYLANVIKTLSPGISEPAVPNVAEPSQQLIG